MRVCSVYSHSGCAVRNDKSYHKMWIRSNDYKPFYTCCQFTFKIKLPHRNNLTQHIIGVAYMASSISLYIFIYINNAYIFFVSSIYFVRGKSSFLFSVFFLSLRSRFFYWIGWKSFMWKMMIVPISSMRVLRRKRKPEGYTAKYSYLRVKKGKPFMNSCCCSCYCFS